MRPSGRTYALVLVALAAVAGLALWIAGAGSGEGDGDGVDQVTVPASADPPATDHRLEIDAPEGAHPVIWVRPGKRAPIRTRPGGGEIAEVAGRRTEFGSPTVFGVVNVVNGWAGVSTHVLPNDRLGWVRLDARRLEAGWTRQSIVVSLSERRAVLREGDRERRAFTVTIGAPGHDTPTGRFAVTDTFRGDLNPVYGCCAVALSAIQPHVPSGWLGGNRIAIHGNGTGAPLGTAASNGCLRAADEHVSALVDEVGLGTPVFIRG